MHTMTLPQSTASTKNLQDAQTCIYSSSDSFTPNVICSLTVWKCFLFACICEKGAYELCLERSKASKDLSYFLFQRRLQLLHNDPALLLKAFPSSLLLQSRQPSSPTIQIQSYTKSFGQIILLCLSVFYHE